MNKQNYNSIQSHICGLQYYELYGSLKQTDKNKNP
jgi:hypothetical protein